MTPLYYRQRGWQTVPVPAGSKRPIASGWNEREFAPADFGSGENVALVLGARALGEFVDELVRNYPAEIGADIDRRFERYAAIDPQMLRAVGGDRFASPPLRVVVT
jgi:hypothetical protein